MSHRTRRTTWLLAVSILALALPQVAAARGDQRGGGSHARGGDQGHVSRHGDRGSRHGKYSARGFERRDHRSQARPERSHARRERGHAGSDRSSARHERRHSGTDRSTARHERRHSGSDHAYARNDYYGHHRGRHYAHASRHHHYPRHGYHVYRLPKRYVSITYGGYPYYYYSGVWYRPYGFGLGYVVAAAPIGAVVTVLPPYYTTVWAYDVPYYYANYTYYRWSPVHDGYLVVDDPGVDASASGGGSDELFVYPNAGQSEEQQADDRYACHRWAVEETGYDPSLGDPSDDESALPGLRSDYQRAMTACLEGRDYTVK